MHMTLGFPLEQYEQGLCPETGAVFDLRDLRTHAVIAGSSGAGKTVTVKALMAGLEAVGIPSLAFDVKGDLSGAAEPLCVSDVTELATARNVPIPEPRALDVCLWSLGGMDVGAPFTLAPKDLGPDFFSMLIGNSSDIQRSATRAAFHRHGDDFETIDDVSRRMRKAQMFGLIDGTPFSKATIRSVQHRIDDLGRNMGDIFGPSTVTLDTFLQSSCVHIVDGQALQTNRLYYAALVGWLLERCLALPDSRDLRMVLFMDEASTLFHSNDPTERRILRGLADTFEEACKKLRSKGIGLVFISQSVVDFPDYVLDACATSIQHRMNLNGLTAAKLLNAVASTFHGPFESMSVLIRLEPGQALIKAPSFDDALALNLVSAPCSIHALQDRTTVAEDSAAWHYLRFGATTDVHANVERTIVNPTPPPPTARQPIPLPPAPPQRKPKHNDGDAAATAAAMAASLGTAAAKSAARTLGRKIVSF